MLDTWFWTKPRSSRVGRNILVWGLALGAALAAGAWCCGSVHRPDGGVGVLSEGALVPALRAVDHRGEQVDLRELSRRGRALVYFYPKDDTPGCTTEACSLRDAWASYQREHISVIGVSSDPLEAHREFARKHSLPFGLVADEDGSWARAFGVGSIAGFHSRVSFLVARGGRIVKVYEDVDPAAHAEEVLRDAEPFR